MNIYISNEKEYLLYHFYPLTMWRVDADSTYEVTNRNFIHKNYVLLYTKNGSGLVCCEMKSYLLKSNSLFLITRDHIKSYCTQTQNWRFDWIEFTTDAPLPSICMLKEQNVSSLFEHLYQALVQQQPQAASSYLYLICQPYLNTTGADLTNPLVAIKYHIDCQPLSSKLSVSELAQRFYISERTLRQGFQKKYHQSPKKYMLQKKMTAAQNLLLTTDLSIQVISETLGFSTTYYFSKAFKSFTGYSPTAFRQHVI